MIQGRGVIVFAGVVVAVALAIVMWSIGRGHGHQTGIAVGDDWNGRLLVSLLILAAFVVGAFAAYVGLRP